MAIALALAHDPDVMLLDEPFGALDALTRECMGRELLRVWHTQRKTMLMVTQSGLVGRPRVGDESTAGPDCGNTANRPAPPAKPGFIREPKPCRVGGPGTQRTAKDDVKRHTSARSNLAPMHGRSAPLGMGGWGQANRRA